MSRRPQRDGYRLGIAFGPEQEPPHGYSVNLDLQPGLQPPRGYRVALKLGPEYEPPRGYRVSLRFGVVESEAGATHFIAPPGWSGTGTGTPFVAFGTRELAPPGIAPGQVGQPTLWNLLSVVAPTGFHLTAYGRPAVANATPQVYPQGFLATLYGTPWLAPGKRELQPRGWNSQSFGAARVWNATFQAFPQGIPPGGVGRPLIYNANRFVEPRGFLAFRGFGEPWVSLSIRRITPLSIVATGWGHATLAGGVRWIDMAGRGPNTARYGRPTAWFYERELRPQWFIATRYGHTLVDFNHDVEPEGFGGELFGRPEVHVPRHIVDLEGHSIRGPAWGEHRVYNFYQHIRPPGWMDGGQTEQDRFGRGEVYNLLQIVVQLFEVTPSDGGVFGNFTYVDNRDRVVRTEGRDHALYGTQARITNNARILRSPPHVEFTLWGDTLVADRIRTIWPRGDETLLWGSRLGNIVYNDARVLAPQGWASSQFGTPGPVWSNMQWFDHLGVDHSAHGEPMVAFRVRTVAPFRMPNPPPFGAVTVDYLNRPIAPPSIVQWALGLTDVFQRFNVVQAWPVLPPVNAIGNPLVRNLTPELRTHGADASLYGTPHVFNEWERYEFQGFLATIFGRHVVKDRRQHVTPPGVVPRPISQQHQVRNVIPDPPATRSLLTAGWVASSIGNHDVRPNEVAPPGILGTSYGTASLVYMGVTPIGIPPPYDESGTQFGRPGLNSTRYVRPEAIEDPVFPYPDTGPRYVWAPRGYPYSTGLWTERGHIMDFYTLRTWNGQQTSDRPVFGRAAVSLFLRTLPVRGIDFLDMGRPRIGVNPQYVRHEGARYQRFGFPRLNADGVAMFAGFDMSLWGRATVVEHDYRPKTLRPAGIYGTTFGLTHIENLHREVLPSGWNSFTISSPQAPSWPRRSHWISLTYDPFPAFGADMARYGTAWVSNYIRHIYPQGRDMAIVARYTPGSFAGRMRVYRDDYVREAGGIGPAGFGVHVVEQGTRFVWPRPMIPRRPPAPAVRSMVYVAPDGWASSVFGDIDRWEAGKVKAHGDDLAEMGRAIIQRALRPAGFAGAAGAPSVSHAVRPVGIPGGGISPPTAIARWCGDKAVSVPGISHGAVGAPAVTSE